MWLFSRFGLPGLLIGGAILYFGGGLMGGDPTASLTPSGHDARSNQGVAGTDPEAEMVQFVSFVLDDAQTTWNRVFSRAGQAYAPARLVLFRDRTASGCGTGQAAMGPFYCPSDQRVYIDLSFYHELKQRFGAPGDFAQAYVIAHEIGHHVQHLLGFDRKVSARDRAGQNSAAVRLELQADCFAGIWAHDTAQRDLLETGDVEEALRAAAAIGDDRLQRQSTGNVTPETWTHGSSAQRVRWFRRGMEAGDLAACDTFEATQL